MFEASLHNAIRRAMGGDSLAIAWVCERAATTDDPLVVVMAALLRHDPAGLDRARLLASAARDRQVVEIARAHLAGDRDRVDALARDHLADHPDSVIVAWIASDSTEWGEEPDSR